MKFRSGVRKGLPVFIVMLVLAGCQRSPEAQSAKYMTAGKRLLQNHDPARAILEFRNAVRITPRNAEAYYQLAIAYLTTGNGREAVAALNKALEMNPKHAGAQLRMAQLMAQSDDDSMLQDAQQRIAALLENDPSNPDALKAYAFTELKMGKVNEALAHLERAMSAAPQEVTLAAIAAQAKLQNNDIKGAEEILKKACESNPKSPDAIVILARLHWGLGRIAEAEQEFQHALTLNPKHVGSLANLASLQTSTGRKAEAEQNFKRLSTIVDNRFNYFYAIFLNEEGRRDEALHEFERLARQDPDDRDARTRLVTAYQLANRTPDAQKLLSDALKKNGKDLDALLQRGELFLEAGKFPEAEVDLNRVVHFKPDSPEVHFALARLHRARGATRFQRQELNEALRLNPGLLPVRLELARALTRDNIPQEALTLLDQLKPAQQNLPAVIEERNWALLAMGDARAARSGIDLGLRGQRSLSLVLQDGLLRLAEKDMNGARAAAQEALRMSPGDVRALQLVASSYAMQNQFPVAIQKVREHASQAATFPAVQFYLGQLLSLSGNAQEARNAFLAAKGADQNYADADVALAQLDANEGKVDEARKRLAGVLSSKSDLLSARLLMAQLDVQARQYGPAADAYRKMLVDNPGNLVVLNNLAYALVETGQLDEALKFAERAKELAPERADVDDTLGWVMYRKGVYASAVQYLERAVVKDNNPVIHYHLAMAHLKAGNGKKGQQVLQATLKVAPGLPEAQMAQAVLAETTKGTKQN